MLATYQEAKTQDINFHTDIDAEEGQIKAKS